MAASPAAADVFNNQTLGTKTFFGGFTTLQFVNGTVVNGNISNQATITPGLAVFGVANTSGGLVVQQSTLTGFLINSGTIMASSASATRQRLGAIGFSNNSVLGSAATPGGITNAGLVAVTRSGTAPTEMFANGIGIATGGAVGGFTGSIVNSGTILGLNSATQSTAGSFLRSVTNGIAVSAVTPATGGVFVGNTRNSGVIAVTSTGSAAISKSTPGGFVSRYTNGVYLTVSSGTSGAAAASATVAANIVNTGQIRTQGNDTIGVTLTTTSGSPNPSVNQTILGINVFSQYLPLGAAFTQIGGVTNSGTIAVSSAATVTAVASNSGGQARTSPGSEAGGIHLLLFGKTSQGATGAGVNQLLGTILNAGALNVSNTSTVIGSATGSTTSNPSAFVGAYGISVLAGGGQAFAATHVNGSTMIGDISNSGAIGIATGGTATALKAAEGTGVGITVVAGGGNTGAAGASGGGALFAGRIVNTGTIGVAVSTAVPAAATQQSGNYGFGIFASANPGSASGAGSSAAGGTLMTTIVNTGMIAISAGGPTGNAEARGVSLEVFGGSAKVTGAVAIGLITNSGTIATIASATGAGKRARGTGIYLAVGGTVSAQGTLAMNVINSGVIVTSGSATYGTAVGIRVGSTFLTAASLNGSIVNTGRIIASGSGFGLGIGINATVPVVGGITNTGTIIGSVAAIQLGTGGPTGTVITQSGGALTGGVQLSVLPGVPDALNITGGTVTGFVVGQGNTSPETLSLTGGTLILRANPNGGPISDSVQGVGSVTQGPGGTLVAQMTPSTAPAFTFPKISAGTITLGGPIQIAEQAGVFANTTTYVNFINATTTLSDHHTSLTSTSALLVPSLVATSATSENLVLTRVPFSAISGSTPNQQAAGSGLEGLIGVPAAAPFIGSLFTLRSQQQIAQLLTDLSAQNLTQALRTSIETPQNLIDGIETRLITGTASIAGETRFAQLRGADQLSDAAAPQGGSGLGISAWAKGYGVFAQAPATIGGSRYHENRHGLLVGGDLAFTENLTLGVAFNYVDTTQHFADGAGSNEATSYLFSGYGGYHDGPWYANWVGGIGINNYNFNRSIGILNATANGASSGYSYLGYAEGGYRLGLGAASVTPYAGLGLTHAQFNGFNETGAGIADLAVNSSDTTSLASTLGVKASMRLPLGSSTVVPEVRGAWQHEFRDTSQRISANFAIAPGNTPFTVVGSNFGRESALVGVGVGDEVTPMLKLYLDYDGKFTGGYTAHAVTAGLKVSF